MDVPLLAAPRLVEPSDRLNRRHTDSRLWVFLRYLSEGRQGCVPLRVDLPQGSRGGFSHAGAVVAEGAEKCLADRRGVDIAQPIFLLEGPAHDQGRRGTGADRVVG